MNISDLEKEIKLRKDNMKDIGDKLDIFFRDYYGIESFSSMVEKFFGSNGAVEICLNRQVATASTQHIAKNLFSDWISNSGIRSKPVALTFSSDSFLSSNEFKNSLCKVPYFNGEIINQRIVKKAQREGLDKTTLSKIITTKGEPLVEHHRKMRKSVFGQDSCEIDVSDFFLRCLKECLSSKSTNKPDYLFVEDSMKEKIILTENLREQVILRPPAEWYYTICFALFLNGSRLFFWLDEHGEKSSHLYNKSVSLLQKATGFTPLTVSIPKRIKIKNEYTSTLVEIPEWILKDKNWREKIKMPETLDLFEAYKYFAEQVLMEGGVIKIK